MRKRDGQLVFSPSDLTVFFESPYASWRDRLYLEDPKSGDPDPAPPELALTAKLGDAHEARVLEALKKQGQLWIGPRGKDIRFDDALALADKAMREGAPTLAQPALRRAPFEGYADFLFRVERPSSLGAYAYEVADSKLAKTPRPSFLIQLCAYADMLEPVQGHRPDHVVVITGDGVHHRYRTDDYFYYYANLRDAFLRFHDVFKPDAPPEPDIGADHKRWQSRADKLYEERDDLSLVANITKGQRKRLIAQGITTATALAKATKASRTDPDVLARLAEQAQLQRASAETHAPKFRLLAHAAGVRRGLGLLPPPSEGDITFDLEGYPFEEGGLEYLFGVTTKDGFTALWAHDHAEEKRVFETFIDRVMAARATHPDLHVFHYGDYERAAVGRLMGRYGTREREVDDLFRSHVFVNLYRVVQQGLRAGVPSYSLKYIERLYRPKRSEEVQTATQSVVEYARFLETRTLDPEAAANILAGIERYNRADCDSTAELTAWLRRQQASANLPFVPAPTDDPGEPQTAEGVARSAAETLAARMFASPPAWATTAEGAQVHETLAHLITFHQREARPIWWEIFDRLGQSDTELVDDPDCLGGLVRTGTPPRQVKRSRVVEYEFDPTQESKLVEGESCFVSGFGEPMPATIDRLDLMRGVVELRLGPSVPSDPACCSLIPNEIVPPKPMVESLTRISTVWQDTGELPGAVRALLLRTPPAFRDRSAVAPVLTGNSPLVDELSGRVAQLDHAVLAIQGPPGTGKTHNAAQVIALLLRQGARVGIASNSHAAIDKLLAESITAAKDVRFRPIKVGGAEVPGAELVPRIAGLDVAALRPPYLLAGTAWVFSADPATAQLDVLFIDEAGQVPLANAVAMAPSAHNIVLLGDQMQLDHPTKGTHPGTTGDSVLRHFLQGHATVPPELGVFLPESHRLHPAICDLISSAIYEGRLRARPGNERRVVLPRAEGDVAAGIVFVPVEHEGNTRESEEEVAAIGALVASLVGRACTDERGERAGVLTPNDILIVAPYNAQVRALKRALPDFKVGTVDKFQGQQARVVIVSLTTSGGETPARGIEFLFSRNRLNVAITRAQCLAFTVGDPRHANLLVRSIEQAGLINLFARLAFKPAAG